jgi:Glycosyltransferase family 87
MNGDPMTRPTQELADDPLARLRLSPRGRRLLELTLLGAAAVLGLVGVFVLVFHVATDPLVDVHAYYDAAARLNSGQPLYVAGGDVDSPGFYRYPPLLAILFRPLALLPFQAAALIWEVAIVGALALTIWRLGARRRGTWIAVAVLAGPIAWSVSIGQAQVIVTLLLALGNPASVALAAQLKLLPALVALYWIGRRDWQHLGRFVAWTLLLLIGQWVVEPAGTLAFLANTNLSQVGEVNNLSPYALSPVLWVVAAGAGVVAALRLAPTRAGWVAAIAVSVLATPRLLEYMLMTLLAAIREPAGRVPAAKARSSRRS